MDLPHKIVVVTGASAGIGAAIAKAMAKAGARVALLARTRAALDQVAAEIRAADGEAQVYLVDMTEAAAVERVAHQITTELGLPDVLVNNAGAGRWLFIEETSPQEMTQMMALPYFGAFYLTRAFMPAMLARRSGHIVNINSPASKGAWPGAIGYTAARWAMMGFTKALEADLSGTGLRVTSVVAGKVTSDYWKNNPGAEARSPTIARLVPTLTCEQVAEATVRAVQREQSEVILPFMLRAFYGLHTFFPRLVEYLLIRTGWKH